MDTDPKIAERHLIVEFNSIAEHVERVKQLLLELIRPARQEAGCLYYDLYQSAEAVTKFYILDGWRDQAAVDAHGKHANVVRVVGELLPLLSGPVSIKASVRISDV